MSSDYPLPDDMDPGAALSEAARVRHSVNRGSRWYIRHLLFFGAVLGGADILVGLFPGGALMVTVMVVTMVFIAVMIVLGVRQPVTFRGFGRVHGVVFGAFGAAHGLVIALGTTLFQEEPAWWIPGGLLVAAPFFFGAAYVANRS